MWAEQANEQGGGWLLQVNEHKERFCSVYQPTDNEWLGRKLEELGPVVKRLHDCLAWQEAVSGAVVDVSRVVSGWRKYAPVEMIASVLREAGLTAPVLGAVGTRFSSDERAYYTTQWLDAHPEVTRWIILDDEAEHWGRVPVAWLGDRLRCPKKGLSPADVAWALRRLGAAP